METRKLIQFGKSSLIISLPKTWIDRNKLKKGDIIYLDEKADSLQIQPKVSEDTRLVKEITIEVQNKDSRMLLNEITAAYVNNYNTIIIRGERVAALAKEIRDIIHNLIALEIMEQTSTKIIAKDFLNMKETSIESLLRKMDLVLRDMMKDAKDVKTQADAYNLNHRDNDINRISYLVFRSIGYSLQDPAAIKSSGMTYLDLLKANNICRRLENTGDQVKRLARLFVEESIPAQDKKVAIQLFEVVQKQYLDAMREYYAKNTQAAVILTGGKREIVSEIKKFASSSKDKIWAMHVAENLRTQIIDIHQIIKTTLMA